MDGFLDRKRWAFCRLLLGSLILLAALASSAVAATRSPAVTATRSSAVAAIRTWARAGTRNAAVTRGSGYLALGDSVPFGYQESAVVPAPNYRQPSTFKGYPEQLGATLHLKVTNLACPGETSGSLINTATLSNGCENGYRKAFPLHVAYRGAQLSYAVAFLRRHPGVRLVSLMIGANDLFLCQKTASDHCLSAAEQRPVLARISANVRRILSAIRNRAHYRGQLVIVNYYSLNYTVPLINSQSQALNNAMDSAAKPFGVRFADGYGELKAASFRFGSNPCLGGLLTQLGTYGTCGVHPSYAGQALLAKAVARAIRL